MNALFILIAIGLFSAGMGLLAFAWAARDGQFSDLQLPAERLAFEEFSHIAGHIVSSQGVGETTRFATRKEPMKDESK